MVKFPWVNTEAERPLEDELGTHIIISVASCWSSQVTRVSQIQGMGEKDSTSDGRNLEEFVAIVISIASHLATISIVLFHSKYAHLHPAAPKFPFGYGVRFGVQHLMVCEYVGSSISKCART